VTPTPVEDRIEQLLRDGATRAEIRALLGCSRYLIDKVRRDRVPPRKPGPRPGRQPSDAVVFATNAEPGDDGHLYWVGRTDRDGTPVIRGTTAYRMAWHLGTGTDPDGLVRPTCGMSACVALDHLTCRRPRSLAAAVISLPHLAELLNARTEPADTAGHRRWIGYTDSGGTPTLRYGHPSDGIESTAYRFIWLLATGTDPAGTVRPTCGMPRCVALEHLADSGATTDDPDKDVS
jgi:hypothetical protein